MNAHTHTLSPEEAATAVSSPGCGGSGMGSPAGQARAVALISQHTSLFGVMAAQNVGRTRTDVKFRCQSARERRGFGCSSRG